MKASYKKLSIIIVSACLLFFSAPAPAADRPVVLGTTSMIGCLLEMLAGDAVEVRVLIPPRSCPGHYDISPGDAAGIAGAGLVIRHDFQAYLDDKLSAQNPALEIEVLAPGGQLLVPEIFRGALEKTAAILSRHYPASENTFRKNLAAATEQVQQAEPLALEKIRLAGLAETLVLGSVMQEPFLRWAGMKVASGFTNSPDELSVKVLARLIDTARTERVSFIAGNLHSGGEQVALALAGQTGLPVAILSNFPGTSERNSTYVDLLFDNIALLARAKNSNLP